DGAESDDRFGNADEQRSRTDRGASLVCADARAARRAGAPAIDRSWARGVSRRLGHRPARLAGHAYTDLTLPGMADAHGYAGAAFNPGANCQLEFGGAGSGTLSGTGDGPRGACGGRGGSNRA